MCADPLVHRRPCAGGRRCTPRRGRARPTTTGPDAAYRAGRVPCARHAGNLTPRGCVRTMRRVLVLASASPRRQRLLAWLGVPFEVDPASVDESPRAAEVATDMVLRLAHAKGAAVAGRRAGDWILAADTTVELDGVLFGKPRDTSDAAGMLAQLEGREHRVAT